MALRNINTVKYRRSIFTVSDNFLTKSPDLNADINYCIQVPQNTLNALNEYYTLLIDLNQTEEQIWQGIYHRTQNEINSFISNQRYQYEFIFPIEEVELIKYISMYNEFAQIKAIRKAESFRLKAYNKEGILAVSGIKQGNKYLCINFYRMTQERASNLYSFHLKHANVENVSGSHFGRAHRALHWLDIKQCKIIGVKYYDFCGWYNGSTDQHLLGINKFKEQFTSHKVKEYSGVIYKSALLRFLKRFV